MTVHTLAVGELEGRPVIVSGGFDRTVRRWDLAAHHPLGDALLGHDNWVFAVAVGHCEGRPVIVSGDYDGAIRVWDLATGIGYTAPLQVQSSVESLACVGRTCVVAGSGGIALLRLQNCKVWLVEAATAALHPQLGRL